MECWQIASTKVYRAQNLLQSLNANNLTLYVSPLFYTDCTRLCYDIMHDYNIALRVWFWGEKDGKEEYSRIYITHPAFKG